MKQALLITAYKDFDHLTDIIQFFDDESFECYIHIDKKHFPNETVVQKIRSFRQVKFVSDYYTVNWGGRNHLRSCLLLAEEALKNSDTIYFHLISGQDFPIKDLAYFKSFATQSDRRDYLTYHKMPYKNWVHGGMNRVEYYNFYDIFDAKKNAQWIVRFIAWQQKIGFKRRISSRVPPLYAGDTWWSLTKETLQHVIDYTSKQPYLLNRMKYTFCAEEMYFQTVIMNSPYATNVVNDNLRYIDWTSGRSVSPAHPAVLDNTDFDKMKNSTALFGRKFESPVSDKLKQMLKNEKALKK
ncbi:MAG: glycosyl transferase family protein [Chitinophagaceae bacterium]|nr:glycosyl transferase family protein [Chitinophagaceae bacterium]